MAKKTSVTTVANTPAGIMRLIALAFGPWRTVTLCALVLGGFAALVSGIWAHVQQNVRQSPQYVVTIDQFTITPPPPWVPAARAKTLPAEALRLASPADHPLTGLDDDLAERITNAFTLNPWVAMAKVTKRAPARIIVDLVYRRPICAVEVTDDLLPVDETGILLPSEDFSLLEKQSLPCLCGIETRPQRAAGQHWGDPHVVEGAAIAAALSPQWTRYKLHQIRLSAGNQYELVTHANSRIVWGLPPGMVAPGEPATEDKLGRLERYFGEHGGLDGASGPQQFDVRSLPRADEKRGT